MDELEKHEGPSGFKEKTETGLDQNVAGLLCYLLGFITGIIFLVLEKNNRFVRFHALQSIFLSIAIIILNYVCNLIPILGWLLGFALSVASFIVWIVLMMKAYQGQWFKLPFIGDMAEKYHR